MKFLIKKPCAECPFRRDVKPYLRHARAEDLARQMSDDNFWFACHQTTGVKNGRRIKKEDQSHCAGLMGVLWNEGRINIAMRIAIIVKQLTIEELKRIARGKVFKNLSAFARHHS